MLGPSVEKVAPFTLESFTQLYQKLDFATRARIFEIFLPENAQLPKKNPPYPSSIFSDKAKQIIYMISYILGYHYDQWGDEPILGFLSIFSTYNKPSLMFNFSQFLADNIHEQFIKFPIEQVFNYTSILIYMFIYYQVDKFSFSLQKLDDAGNQQPVIFGTSLVMKEQQEFTYKKFIEDFFHPAMNILKNALQTRINEEIKRILHLSNQAKTGDWYLYQNYTEIRVYGYELAPYKLPKIPPNEDICTGVYQEDAELRWHSLCSAQEEGTIQDKDTGGPICVQHKDNRWGGR